MAQANQVEKGNIPMFQKSIRVSCVSGYCAPSSISLTSSKCRLLPNTQHNDCSSLLLTQSSKQLRGQVYCLLDLQNVIENGTGDACVIGGVPGGGVVEWLFGVLQKR
jgi:hypothetical protein